jgi:1-phosphatidylinositol-3-phosphate 5-kinase
MAVHRHDSDKPRLPPLASRPSRQTPLTIESIDHLHKLVSHVLEEETSFRDGDKDAWVSSIESALNDLARAVESGAWLSGIRRARAVLARKRKEQQLEPSAAASVRMEMGVREQDRIAKDKDKETEARSKATPKGRVPASADTTKPVNAKDTTETAGAEVKTDPSSLARKPPDDIANRNLCALQQLRNLANASRRPSSDGANKRAQHLLLTVAPPDASTPRHPSSVSPAGDTTLQRCTFTPSVYSLPAPDLFGEDPDDNCQAVVNSTLYGFEDWDGAYLLSNSASSLTDFPQSEVTGDTLQHRTHWRHVLAEQSAIS